MKESDFIEQNKEKWKNFEHNLIKKDATPQEISKLFVQITDDLSYARTFYSARSVKIYLNVAFTTFFLGVFASIGSLVIMMYNGVMVGVFQFFFVEKDVLQTAMDNNGVLLGFIQYFFIEDNLFRKSFLSIWTHGTLEISAIIIAGGAGITLGKGLLFPRT